MGWKEWPAWLKGGIILAVIHLFVFAILVYPAYLRNKNVPAQYEPWPVTMIMTIPDFPVFVLLYSKFAYNLFGEALEGFATIWIIIFGTLQWFVIGAGIGWIVEKIRGKKTVGAEK